MTTEQHARRVDPEDGRLLVNPIGGRMVLKVTDAMTAGAYSIHDNILPPHSPGPTPHLHRWHEETFYVLAGELTLRVGNETLQAGAGAFVVIPRGVVHQPSNRTADETHVLLIFSPGGMDQFFVEAAQGRYPLQSTPNEPGEQARLRAFTERYGYEFADLPGGG